VTTTPAPPSPEQLPTQYVPAEVEGPLYERWVERGYFTADVVSSGVNPTLVPRDREASERTRRERSA